MLNLIYAEYLKNKRTWGIIILLVGSVLGSLLGTFLYVANKQVFIQNHTQWLALWGESNLFASQIFLPMFLGIIIGNNVKNELNNNNLLRIIVSPVKVTQLIMSKWLYMIFLELINQIISLIIFLIIGHLLNLPEVVNIGRLFIWSILGWVGSLGIIAIQLWIAMRAKNFTTNLLINFGVIIVGLIISIANSKLGSFYPYNQIMIGLHAKTLTSFDQSQIIIFILVIILSTLFGLSATNITVKKMLLK
ncbi:MULTISPECIES: ABC transporter permease [Leuconostoc]|jgi:hypothetical protein|uniref:ABC transporter permease n=1 Tax=Leuconostoc TaxID=1243 RepID=UPI001CBE5AAB|nr:MULTISPECIES: ABC transporter permease [Leuconostoc]MCH3952208.1 ABC transporter permease [Leuconostoc mesenteroides]